MYFFNNSIVLIKRYSLKKFNYLFVLTILGAVVESLGVGLMLPVVTAIIDPPTLKDLYFVGSLFEINFKKYGIQNTINYFLIFTLIYFVLRFFILSYLLYLQSDYVYGFQEQIGKQLFISYMNSNFKFHQETNSSKLIRNIQNEVNSASGAMFCIVNILSEILVFLFISLILLILSPTISLIIIMILIFFGCMFYFGIWKKTIHLGEMRQKYMQLRLKCIQQGLGAIKEVKLMMKEFFFINEFILPNKRISDNFKYQAILNAFPRIFIESFALCVFIMILIYTYNQNFNFLLLLPTITLYFTSFLRLLPSYNRILSSIQTLRYNFPAVLLLNEELKSLKETQIKGFEQRDYEKINFKNLSLDSIFFSYKKSDKRIFSDLNFNFNYKDKIGIIGKSGIGKSTLIDIILGLINPQKGCVYVNGKNLKKVKKEWLSIIGYVPQKIYLLDDTINNNIIFGNYFDKKKLIKAVKTSRVDGFLDKGAGNLDKVGERGSKLSGGQIQRIGIARALYKSPKILVLDEATSALDLKNEKIIIKNIVNNYKNITLIIISHRRSTLDTCTVLYEITENNIIKIK